MNTRHRDNYPRMNCIVVFNKTKDRILFCKRQKDPFGGRLNFVGGKVEKGESSEDAAYRELYEETGVTRRQIRLFRLMDMTYYYQAIILEMYVGMLSEDVELKEEKNPLLWLPLTEDFTDRERFAGEQNIAHIINVAMLYPIPGRDMMSDGHYIGIDGCKDGWIIADLDYGQLTVRQFEKLSEFSDEYYVEDIDKCLIDMPIGLPEKPEDLRPDAEARKELRDRGTTVFPVPCRQAVYKSTEAEQKTENLRILGKSLSKQSTAIIPKIREVDTFLEDHQEYRKVICESHPEVCFSRLNGGAFLGRKKEYIGITQRQAILSGFLQSTVIDDVWSQATGLHCNPDDILDAVCLVVTAALDAHHLCETIPEEPQKDARGLRMQMVVPAI